MPQLAPDLVSQQQSLKPSLPPCSPTEQAASCCDHHLQPHWRTPGLQGPLLCLSIAAVGLMLNCCNASHPGVCYLQVKTTTPKKYVVRPSSVRQQLQCTKYVETAAVVSEEARLIPCLSLCRALWRAKALQTCRLSCRYIPGAAQHRLLPACVVRSCPCMQVPPAGDVSPLGPTSQVLPTSAPGLGRYWY